MNANRSNCFSISLIATLFSALSLFTATSAYADKDGAVVGTVNDYGYHVVEGESRCHIEIIVKEAWGTYYFKIGEPALFWGHKDLCEFVKAEMPFYTNTKGALVRRSPKVLLAFRISPTPYPIVEGRGVAYFNIITIDQGR